MVYGIRLHLWHVTGSGKGARLLRVRLRLNFAASGLICTRHQLRRLQQPRLVTVCIFAGPRKTMHEGRLKIIPVDISFVWCQSFSNSRSTYPINFLLFDDRCQSSNLLDEKRKSSKYAGKG